MQSGVLPYRVEPDGAVRILLISSSRARQWTIPKGTAEPYLSLSANAAKEAFEEAGVVGEIAPKSAGMFRAVKRVSFAETVIEVWVFLLRVTRQVDDWPEKSRRLTRWVSCEEAARLLREPFLRDLCEQIEAHCAAKAVDKRATGTELTRKVHKRAKAKRKRAD